MQWALCVWETVLFGGKRSTVYSAPFTMGVLKIERAGMIVMQRSSAGATNKASSAALDPSNILETTWPLCARDHKMTHCSLTD